MDGSNVSSVGRIPPVHRRRPAQEYQDSCMASCSSQLQDALSPTGYQEMLPHRSGTANYLGCASSRSQGVYTIYTMSCPDPACILSLLHHSTTATARNPAWLSFGVATPSGHEYSFHGLFFDFGVNLRSPCISV